MAIKYNSENQLVRGGGELSLTEDVIFSKIKYYRIKHACVFGDHNRWCIDFYVMCRLFNIPVSHVANEFKLHRITVKKKIDEAELKIAKQKWFKREIDKIYAYIIYNAKLIYG